MDSQEFELRRKATEVDEEACRHTREDPVVDDPREEGDEPLASARNRYSRRRTRGLPGAARDERVGRRDSSIEDGQDGRIDRISQVDE